ncbi:hypothetical protein [Streptomyces jumonjinensis]|uniref:hypothetical protein n=1 Tax=Streptomyces jumonjinensis TaxID=1945 RepID=UPI0037B0ECC9
MNKPNRLMTFLYALVGKSYVHESVDQVREAIASKCFSTLADRAEGHARGADSLTDLYAFQPGLLDLHDELHDTWHYLTALKARAAGLGCASLTDRLEDAANATSEVLKHVAEAAEATVPHQAPAPK